MALKYDNKVENMSLNNAEKINILGQFCGKRDVQFLSADALSEKYNLDTADVMVLFGGSIIAGGDLFAQAIKAKIAKTYIIVGGAGHTTQTLRRQVHNEYPFIETADLPEAVIFQRYLKEVHSCEADFLETQSTNCGNNITNLLNLLEAEKIPCRSIILCQDATMQNRMDAGMRKYAPEGTVIINFASYRADVVEKDGILSYRDDIHGMWSMERYINLLMGEIPRLTDDAHGYGPAGKDFIAHVDIPEEVKHAFKDLQAVFGNQVREANPLYAS